MDELGDPATFRCSACKVVYHASCARELGGCGTLGCAQAGVGPDGPVSLASLQRHVDRVAGRPTAMDTSAINERAVVIREALLAERAKLLEERRIRKRFETAQRRKKQLGNFLTLALLVIILWAAAEAIF